MNTFLLTTEDEHAISIAIDTARRILQNYYLTPQQIIGLGNALLALERLPEATSGVRCEFGFVLRISKTDFSEMRYIDFRIHETEIAICKGGSSYSKEVGSDSYTEPGWLINIKGNRRTVGCNLFEIESDIKQLIEEDATVSVEDESLIDIH